jgi:hypothetical protein
LFVFERTAGASSQAADPSVEVRGWAAAMSGEFRVEERKTGTQSIYTDPSSRATKPIALDQGRAQGDAVFGFVVAFVVLSVPIVYVSRASLRAPGSHGFYRFFAWESIVALVLLDIPVWFNDPFTWHQLISWVLLFICFVPLILGVRTLTTRGKPVKRREDDASLLAFEKTSTLVTTGI